MFKEQKSFNNFEKKENINEIIDNYIEIAPPANFYKFDDQAVVDEARVIFGMDYWSEQYLLIKKNIKLNDDLDSKILKYVFDNYRGDINIVWKEALIKNLLSSNSIKEEERKIIEEKVNTISYKPSDIEQKILESSNKVNLDNFHVRKSEMVDSSIEKREKPIENVLLIFPPSGVNGVGLENCMIPNGILSIGSYIKEKLPNINVDVLDGSITSLKDILKIVQNNNPDVVGISMLAGNSENSDIILKTAKECGAITVVGNHHARYLQDQLKDGLIKSVDNVDYLIEGRRGELSFVELIEAINKKGEGLKDIKSLACAQENNLFINENRQEKDYPKMANSSEPDLSLIKDFDPYFKKYNEIFGKFHEGEDVKQINVNYIKGCLQGMKKPCSYCCLKDHKFDFLEPEEYWNKIKKLSFKGFNFVFETCNSITSLDKIKKGGDSYLKRLSETMPTDLKEKIKMQVYGRVDEINDTTIEYLKKMNVCRIVFGFDSGSKTLVDGIGKINITPDKNLEVAKKLNEADIQIYGCYVAGAKGESPETLEETYKQIMEIMSLKNTAAIEYTSLAPMPGSASWDGVKDAYFEKYGNKISVEKLSKLWVEMLKEKGEIDVTWEEIEESKQKLKAEADKRGIVFGGYY